MAHTKLMLMIGTILILVLAGSACAQLPDSLWQRTYGGEEDDEGYCIRQTADGGFIITGYSFNDDPNHSDILLMKLDSDGNEEWTEYYGDVWDDLGRSVLQVEDGGYVICGERENSINIMKVNEARMEVWSYVYEIPAPHAYGQYLIQTEDNGFMIFGSTTEDDNLQALMIKTNSEGVHQWTRTYGDDQNDSFYTGLQTADGGYIAAGSHYVDAENNLDVYVVKTTSAGVEEWHRTYGSPEIDVAHSIQALDDGGYVIIGTQNYISSAENNLYLLRIDENADEVWSRIIDIDEEDNGYCVQVTDDGGFLFAATVYDMGWSHQIYMLKTDGDGNTEWEQLLGWYFDDNCYWLELTADGGFIITGSSEGLHAGDLDVMALRFEGNTGITDPHLAGSPTEFSITGAYPNPFNPSTVLSYQIQAACFVNLAVYDVHGRKVADLVDGWRGAGVHEVTFDGSGLASGLYFYRLTAGEFSGGGKMVLLK